MTRKLLSALACIVIASLLGCSRAPEPDAFTAALVNIVKKDAKYTRWTKIECLQFMVEQQDDKQTDIAMREKHGAGCPGDPATAPIVDRFRIEKSSGIILRYDVIDDQYLPVGTMRR